MVGQDKMRRRKPNAPRKQMQLGDNESMLLNFHRQECLKILENMQAEKRFRYRKKLQDKREGKEQIEDDQEWKNEYNKKLAKIQFVKIGLNQTIDVIN